MAESDPLDPRGMRRHNLQLVLRSVADDAGSSRAKIAAGTGLNKTTVSSLVSDLIDRGLLIEAGITQNGHVGRPAIALELNGDCFVALGLEVNADHLAFAAVDLLGRVRDEGRVRRENRGRAASDTLKTLAALVQQALERLDESGLTPVGATLGIPGLVDRQQGIALIAPNLGWREVHVGEQLRRALGDPAFDIRVENEANLAALAERWSGLGQTIEDFIYVSGYIGVGAGLVTAGGLHRGDTQFGGEFGHMTLEADGPPCTCGSRGCVEALVGLEALLRLAGQRSSGSHRPGTLGGEASVDLLVAAARDGDAQTLGAMGTIGTRLGAALASAVNLLGSRAVVLGGYFAALYEWLHEPIEQELATRVLSHPWSPVEVLRSTTSQGAAVRGAAALSLRAVLDDPMSIRCERISTEERSPGVQQGQAAPAEPPLVAARAPTGTSTATHAR